MYRSLMIQKAILLLLFHLAIKLWQGKKVNKTEQAKMVGSAIAEKAKAAGINEVVFDRGGYLYHGRVKALADAAREAGLKF